MLVSDRRTYPVRRRDARHVLILVLVDVGLGQTYQSLISQNRMVLILVLVDVGLGQELEAMGIDCGKGLNPCFSGCWSRTFTYLFGHEAESDGLNPCFSGCWSRTGVFSNVVNEYMKS